MFDSNPLALSFRNMTPVAHVCKWAIYLKSKFALSLVAALFQGSVLKGPFNKALLSARLSLDCIFLTVIDRHLKLVQSVYSHEEKIFNIWQFPIFIFSWSHEYNLWVQKYYIRDDIRFHLEGVNPFWNKAEFVQHIFTCVCTMYYGCYHHYIL